MRRALVVVAGPVVAMFGASQAFACTLCHSRTAQDVRAAVFGPDFWDNVAAMSAVVPALVLAVVLVRRISP
ncbi:hypothetical protein [Blastomonas aquatica]|uniref:hypothetical protein n=1 Tax=Blastomonas aquatica TaxID=1510276 RepID=UPI001E479E64|nr:hypothetical protein [Blastomonas aquatica]